MLKIPKCITLFHAEFDSDNNNFLTICFAWQARGGHRIDLEPPAGPMGEILTEICPAPAFTNCTGKTRRLTRRAAFEGYFAKWVPALTTNLHNQGVVGTGAKSTLRK